MGGAGGLEPGLMLYKRAVEGGPEFSSAERTAAPRHTQSQTAEGLGLSVRTTPRLRPATPGTSVAVTAYRGSGWSGRLVLTPQILT